MPRIIPKAAPMITWLNKCLIKKTLDSATAVAIKNKAVVNTFCRVNKYNTVAKRKKLSA